MARSHAKRLSAVLAATLVVTAFPALADDFSGALDEAQRMGSVRVVVSGWQAITGDEDSRTFEELIGDGSKAESFQSGVLKSASTGGGTVRAVRRYRYLPLIALEADAVAMEAVRSANPSAKVWRDKLVSISLSDSTRMIGATKEWRSGFTGKDTMVAVLDTGVAADHPFLRGKVAIEACFAAQCPNGKAEMVGPGAARPVHMHGTHVAGIVAGRGDDRSGVAPDARLVAINVFSIVNGMPGSLDSDILAGLDFVAKLIKVDQLPIVAINMSLGSNADDAGTAPCRESPYQAAATYLRTLGVVTVAAAGNESNKKSVSAPACAPDVVSVGAEDKQGRVADFSNSAPYLDIVAPGAQIVSANWEGGKSDGFVALDGTSMAAPHVAGAVAVLREADLGATPKQIVAALRHSSHSVRDAANGVTSPGLDLEAAVKFLRASANVDVPPEPAPQPKPEPQPKPKPKPKPAPGPGGNGWKPLTGD